MIRSTLRVSMVLGSMALLASLSACKKVVVELVPEVTKAAIQRATSPSPTREQQAIAAYKNGLSLLEAEGPRSAGVAFEKAAMVAPAALAHLAPLAAKADNGPDAHERLRVAVAAADLKLYEPDRGYPYWYRLTNEHVHLVIHAKDPAAHDRALAAFQRVHRDLQAFIQSKGNALHPSFRMYAGHVDSFAKTAATRDRPRGQLLEAHHYVLAATSNLTLLEENDRLK
jgi:hypothetical protein